ncbi:ABC transporter permease subunit [Peloplasma aerotolerans]|uniref:ABC transporter permease subunit n=1 Tax=Peloplasma aerotolerans TaxID=3044389 RepID=A0AAW6U9Y3_9MOLU|nr:ABC transporter permease subunit [Mariniplasma sp. M4Ah]MDI6453530.1 ABC transporter permease subunit [Mariniplasma sp. M4Ah]MDR4968872.1 ABC transporter permease subunit [Acholeplasmataceae bacterium]
MNLFSKDLYKIEIRRNFKSNMIWSFALGLSLFLIVAIYPMVAEMMDALNEMLEYLESIDSSFIAMMESFGGIPDNVMEYFATEGALFLQLLGGIYAAMLGFGIVSKDEKENTVEVIYVLPISRAKLLTTKMLSVATLLFIFTFIQMLLTQVGFIIVAPGESHLILWEFGLFDYVMFLMIAYLSMGLAMFLKPNKSPLISIAIPFPLYIITMISSATNNDFLKALKYISPFTFTEPVGFLKEGHGFELINFLTFSALTIIVVILSFKKFRKREMI